MTLVPLLSLVLYALPGVDAVSCRERPRLHHLDENVVALAADPSGFLWVASEDRLRRFDGQRLQEPDPSEPETAPRAGGIRSVAFDEHGTAWIWRGSSVDPVFVEARGREVRRWELPIRGHAAFVMPPGGVPLVITRTAVFEMHEAPHKWPVQMDLGEGPLRAKPNGSGAIWVGAASGLWRVSPREGAARLAEEAVSTLLQTSRHLLVGLVGRGLWLRSDADQKLVPIEEAPKGGAIVASGARGETAFIASRSGVYSLRASDEWKPQSLLDYDEQPGAHAEVIEATPDGSVWVAFGGGELLQVPPPRPFDGIRPGRSPLLFSVRRDPAGGVLLVTGRSLFRHQGGQLVELGIPEGLSSPRSAYRDRSGTLWLTGTWGGLWRQAPDEGRWQRAPWSPQRGPVVPLLEDDDDALWFGLPDGGVAKLPNDSRDAPTIFTPQQTGLSAPVTSAVADKDRLVFGSRGSGAAYFQVGSNEWTRIEAPQAMTHVVAVRKDTNGGVWLATEAGGLAALDSDWKRASGLDLPALRGRRVGDVLPGPRFTWVLTGRGLLKIEGPLQGPHPPRITAFTAADGLPSDRGLWGFSHGLALDDEGQLWVATHRGALRFPDPDAAQATTIPAVTIDGVMLDGRRLRPPSPFANVGNGNLEFLFAVPMYVDRARLRFRHRLRELSDTWHAGGDFGSAYFANVPPGRYTFEIEAYANDGSAPGDLSRARMVLTLSPPLWRTLPFRLALALALAAAATLLLRARFRRLARQYSLVAEERSRIAREIHDSLEQTLFAAKWQLETAEEIASDAQRGILEKLHALLERGMAETRDAVWALRSGTFGRLPLHRALTALAEEALAGAGISCAVKVEGAPFALPAHVEWHLGRIVREALTNILKHAGASSVEILLAFEPHQLVTRVRDDGRGAHLDREAKAKEGHFGLRGMEERARALGATLSIETTPGCGTTVIVTIPKTRRTK